MMRRACQLALPLGQTEPPEPVLRAAWERCRLRQGFEEAMRLPHLRICIRHVALALAKQRRMG